MRLFWKVLILFCAAAPAHAKPRNVILVVADGFGPQQYSLALSYAHLAPKSPYKTSPLNLEKILNRGKLGFMTTSPYAGLVTDSAASATQIATGELTYPGAVGLDAKQQRKKTVLELAHEKGYTTAIVSNTILPHATPAAFAAHVPNRTLLPLIAEQMLSSGVDIMLSGGLQYFIPENWQKSATFKKNRQRIPKHIKLRSRRGDNKDLLGEALERGYENVFSLSELKKSNARRVLGLFAADGMPNGIEEKLSENNPTRRTPTLRDMIAITLEKLEARKKKFFLVVEAGQIDWAAHEGDGGTMLNEIIQFDKALAPILGFVSKRKDTLLVLVSDHETGSFGLTSSSLLTITDKKSKYAGGLFPVPKRLDDLKNLDRLYAQKKPFRQMFAEFRSLERAKQTPENLHKIIRSGIAFDYSLDDAKELFRIISQKSRNNNSIMAELVRSFYSAKSTKDQNQLSLQLSSRQQIVWGTGTHTATMVPMTFLGYGQDQFRAVMHSTELGKSLIALLRND